MLFGRFLLPLYLYIKPAILSDFYLWLISKINVKNSDCILYIQVILKPALGSFCTLDPLGYDYKQMDVMFMTLGSMIGQLRKDSVGEHQLRLLFSLLRTCAGMSTSHSYHKVVSSHRSWDGKLMPLPACRTNFYGVWAFFIILHLVLINSVCAP